MTIAAAALAQDANQLADVLDKYLAAGIELVDIDIQQAPFASNSTVSVEEAIAVVRSIPADVELSITWDLKISDPSAAVRLLLQQAFPRQRIVVYQSAFLDFIQTLDCKDLQIGVGLLDTDQLRDLDFYNQFSFVQIMTVAAETHGGELSISLLDKISDLRSLGYRGEIGIDGGVNLDSADNIFPLAQTGALNRLSVGSFFQNTENAEALEVAWQSLAQNFS